MILRERTDELELIDGPLNSFAELEESFHDIERANRIFGGLAAARHGLRRFDVRTVLDVGAGIADIPAGLRREFRSNGKDVRFTCLDMNDDVLEMARARYSEDDGVDFVRGDGESLPFDNASFDVAMCNLALHHFAERKAIALLRELRRVSKLSPLVTDLQRSALTLGAAFAFSRLFTSNRLTRHDAPLSAKRAYTPNEALSLARRAGWEHPHVESFQFIRMILIDASV
ncbi:MAG: methyltransferase domain-containing protein [Candidatus Eremiobacteraeota bacterium]|nr:methyltransferase domain-containing protein [Candidatus Eremiobacteraeota bacterium]